MEFNYGLLKQRIKDEYKTYGNFARTMGISDSRLSCMLNGKMKMTVDVVYQMVRLLGLEGHIEEFFFTEKFEKSNRGRRCSRTDF